MSDLKATIERLSGALSSRAAIGATDPRDPVTLTAAEAESILAALAVPGDVEALKSSALKALGEIALASWETGEDERSSRAADRIRAAVNVGRTAFDGLIAAERDALRGTVASVEALLKVWERRDSEEESSINRFGPPARALRAALAAAHGKGDDSAP